MNTHSSARTAPLRTAALAIFLTGTITPHAMAASECVDRWGHKYIVNHRSFNDSEAMKCTPLATPPQGAVQPPSYGEATQALSSEALQRLRTGGLVLLPPPAHAPVSAAARRAYTGLDNGNDSLSNFRSSSHTTSIGSGLYTNKGFDALIESTARLYGHDADLLRAIIHVESRFNPNAVSPKGAIGLMQVMPATAAWLGLAQPKQQLFDPEANIRTGSLYLRKLFVMFSGRTDLVVAAYNAGEGSVRRYNHAVPPFPETQAYVRNVMARYENLRRSR